MRRALLVVDFNNALCANSRASMQAAAARWGAEYLEINEAFFTDRQKPKVSPAALKCFCFELSDADEFFILDADIVVSGLCPNPFEWWADRPELVAVRNGSARFGDLGAIRNCERYEWNKLLNEEPRLAGAPYIEGQYFNTGMMLVRRRYHKGVFELISDIVQTDHGLGWNDQTPIVASIAKLNIAVRLADERWNWIHPGQIMGDWMDMRKTGAYIYHGAGEPGRNDWLPKIIWQ